MCARVPKKSRFSKRANKVRVTPVSENAPTAPVCPDSLRCPSTSTWTPIRSRPGRDTGCGFVPRSAFLEGKLTAEVEQYEEDGHRKALKKAEVEVKAVLKFFFKGIQIWTTGSLPAGVDLDSSDVDMTVKLPNEEGKSSIKRLYEMKEKLRWVRGLSKVWVQSARVPVLQLVHAETGVEIDVSIDNDDGKRNTQLLAWYGQIDARIPLLCKAVKGWASSVGVEGAKMGRLNSFTLCLMTISYLQVGVSPPIAPNLQELFPELNGEIVVEDDDYQKRNLRKELEERGHAFEENESSVGVLFAGFLKYYAEFDFLHNWISVRRGRVIEKRWDEDLEPLDGMPRSSKNIVVEDPFIKSPWNCGGSVWHSGTFERIHEEFQMCFERLLKTRSIFGSLMSISRRKLEEAGKERDLHIEKWKEELCQERRRKCEEEEKHIPWGTTTYETVVWRPPYDDIEHPRKFWDLPQKQSPLTPWPEAVRMCFPC